MQKGQVHISGDGMEEDPVGTSQQCVRQGQVSSRQRDQGQTLAREALQEHRPTQSGGRFLKESLEKLGVTLPQE